MLENLIRLILPFLCYELFRPAEANPPWSFTFTKGISGVPEEKQTNKLEILAEWLRLDTGCASRPHAFEGAYT